MMAKIKPGTNNMYPELDQLIGIYFGEDGSYWGDSINQRVSSYKEDVTPAIRQKVLAEIKDFERDHPDNLEQAFVKIYGSGLDLSLWKYTAASFLDEIKRLLKE
jgi:hypothetical protein